MSTSIIIEEYQLLHLRDILQKQLETVNECFTDFIQEHLRHIGMGSTNAQLYEDFLIMAGPAAALNITMEVSSETRNKQPWTTLLQLSPGLPAKDKTSALDGVQLLARFLLLCLRKQGLLDRVASDVSEQKVYHEAEDDTNVEHVSEEETVVEENDDKGVDFDEIPPTISVNLATLSCFGPHDLLEEKTAFLAPNRLHSVQKMTQLHCDHDPAWALELLERSAPRLEALHMLTPSRAHLQVLETMRRLSRLDVRYLARTAYDADHVRPHVFRTPPATHCGLEWLRVAHLPEETTFSLIRAHRRSLRELWLGVGTWRSVSLSRVRGSSSSDEEAWPTTCRDLEARLGRCLARTRAPPAPRARPPLWRIVLFRWLWVHDDEACRYQLSAVRDVLPGVSVLCFDCQHIQDISL